MLTANRPAVPTFINPLNRILVIGALLLAVSSPASSYNTFSYIGPGPDFDTLFLKWGDNHAGTPGGIITWSLMPDGTTVDPSAPSYVSGTSDLNSVFNQVGGQAAALALMQQGFDNWSATANIQFVYVGVDDGTPFSAPYDANQVIGNIRVGGFEITGGSADVGFAPPPNGGTTLEGDILFNTDPNISYYVAPGNEGDMYDLYPPGGGLYRNDFQGLFTHEIGHAIGLAHSADPNSVMCGYVDAVNDGSQCGWYDINNTGQAPIIRIPRADDIAGAQFLYGPAPVPEPSEYALLLAGLSLTGWRLRARRG